MSSQYESLFTQFGLPQETATDYINRKRRQAFADRRAAYGRPDTTTGVGSASNLGNIIGSHIVARTQNLTENEQKGFRAAELARNRFENMVERGELNGASYREKANAFQAILADASFESGLQGIGTQVANDLYEKKHKQEVQRHELNRLEHEEALRPTQLLQAQENLRSTRLANTGAQQNIDREKIETNIWKFGETDPNQGFIAEIGNDGVARTADGREFKPGEYTTNEPYAGRSGGSEVRDWVTPSIQYKIKQQASAFAAQVRSSSELVRAIGESVNPDGSVNILSGSGSLIDKVSGLESNVRAILRQYFGSGASLNAKIVDIDGNTIKRSDVANIIAANPEVNALINSKAGQDRARMQALMTRLVMMQARVNEPSARSYTEGDIQRASAQVGTSLTNPNIMRQVMRSNVNESRQNLDDVLSTYPDHISSMIIGDKFRRRLYGVGVPGQAGFSPGYTHEFDSLTLPEFGTADAVGPALQGTGLRDEKPIVEGETTTQVKGGTNISPPDAKEDAQQSQSELDRVNAAREELNLPPITELQ